MGICVLCNNLVRQNLNIGGKPIECYTCSKDKFNIQDALGFWSFNDVSKPCKSVKGIAENCDCWDDRLKPKIQKY